MHMWLADRYRELGQEFVMSIRRWKSCPLLFYGYGLTTPVKLYGRENVSGFDSRHILFFVVAVAQLVARRAFGLTVVGSSPTCHLFFRR
jgi:hypothetical protein